MESREELNVWLPWVIKIRFVIISFVFAIDFSLRELVPNPTSAVSIRSLGIAIILWYVVSLFFLIYNQISRDYLLQAYLQLFSDIVIITAIVHLTGDLDSHYTSLYLLVIILSSVLLPRASAFMVAAVSFVFMGSLLELAYLPNIDVDTFHRYPKLAFLQNSSAVIDLRTLQVKIFVSLFGFFAVAYLSSFLAEHIRRAGAELREKTGQVASLQAFTANIIQSMRDGLITTNLAGEITEINPAGAAILGREAAQLKGQSISSVIPNLETSGHEGTLREEVTFQRPEGGYRIVGIASSPLVLPGSETVGQVYNFQDLTEQKRREAEYRAKDKLAMVGRLSAGIAHEIRNPLTSIAGSVKLLRSLSEFDEDQKNLIDIVSGESERLNKLLSDFLAYSIDQRYDFRQMDVARLLDETLTLLEHHPLLSPRHELRRTFPRQPVMASVDADKIKQVFWNVCDNSLKAMPNGGTLTAEILGDSAYFVSVVLTDTGIGFTEAQLEKIFEPFQTGFANGTGLGLAIAYQILEAHHGSITVGTTPGKGSRFLIELPKSGD